MKQISNFILKLLLIVILWSFDILNYTAFSMEGEKPIQGVRQYKRKKIDNADEKKKGEDKEIPTKETKKEKNDEATKFKQLQKRIKSNQKKTNFKEPSKKNCWNLVVAKRLWFLSNKL